MLLFADHDELQGKSEELWELGFGMSVRSRPDDVEIDLEKDSVIKMFLAWGWNGFAASMPAWMKRDSFEQEGD